MLDDFCTKFIQLSYCEKKSLKYISVFLLLNKILYYVFLKRIATHIATYWQPKNYLYHPILNSFKLYFLKYECYVYFALFVMQIMNTFSHAFK